MSPFPSLFKLGIGKIVNLFYIIFYIFRPRIKFTDAFTIEFYIRYILLNIKFHFLPKLVHKRIHISNLLFFKNGSENYWQRLWNSPWGLKRVVPSRSRCGTLKNLVHLPTKRVLMDFNCSEMRLRCMWTNDWHRLVVSSIRKGHW